MISPSYVRAMARYNAWQNASVYGMCEQLSDGGPGRIHRFDPRHTESYSVG